MNTLPRLLRRLEQAAHDDNTKALDDVFEQLGRNDGWSSDVAEFIERMPAKERATVALYRERTGS